MYTYDHSIVEFVRRVFEQAARAGADGRERLESLLRTVVRGAVLRGVGPPWVVEWVRERASAARDVALLTRELCEGLMDRYGPAVCRETVVGP